MGFFIICVLSLTAQAVDDQVFNAAFISGLFQKF